MTYYEQDLNNQITVLSLLAHGIPKAKKIDGADVDVDGTPCVPNSKGMYSVRVGDVCTKATGDNEYTDRSGFEDGSAKTNYTQKVLYQIAKALINSNNNDDLDTENDMGKVNGQRIDMITDLAVITSPKYIYVTLPSSDLDNGSVDVKIFERTHKHLNQVYVNILHKLASHRIGNFTDTLNAMQDLWVAQSMKHHVKTAKGKAVEHKTVLPPDFNKMFRQLLADMHHYNHKTQITTLTYQDLVDFYNEVQSGTLTSKTRNVQEWLFGQRSTKTDDDKARQILNLLQMHSNFKDVANHVTEVPVSDIKGIIRKMNHDTYFRHSDFDIDDVYRMDYKQHHAKGKHHFIGVHGTNSFSIPTIMLDNLKTHNELVASGQKNYEDTAQALGDGVYLADLRQASKSLNYSNSYDAKYKWLIVADVAYNKPVVVNSYYTPRKPYDFIKADDVGPSHGYSEYVARHGRQIRIKYIICFRKFSH